MCFMFKSKISKYLLIGGMTLIGLMGGIAAMASAQSVAITTSTPTSNVINTSSTTTSKTRGHTPLGGDGIVSSITGTTIVMTEESDEGGASYTVDVSNGKLTVNGAAASISDIKVGQKIFVQGTTNGTNVVATSVSVGHGEGYGKKKTNVARDNKAGEANESSSSSTSSNQ